MFHSDSKLIRALNRIADLVAINLLAFVCCIPLFTIGASWTAMYACIFKLREQREGYLYRDFFKAFKENFKQATLIWLPMLLLALFLFMDYRIFLGLGGWSDVLQVVVLAIGILLFFVAVYAFPMQAYFINPVRATLRNALLTAISRPGYTLALAVLNLLPFVLLSVAPVLFGVYLLLGMAGIGWLCSYFLKKIFAAIRIV